VIDPIALILNDGRAANRANDPMSNLCGLSTVGLDGRPKVRTLILWDVRNDGLALLANTTSPKHHELERDPHFEALLVWPIIQRQYRLRGEVREMTASDLSTLWNRKRYELKLLDHYYSRYQGQSLPVVREEFLRLMGDLESEFPDSATIPVPDSAIGLLLNLDEIDVWNGSARFPERTLFRRNESVWTETALTP